VTAADRAQFERLADDQRRLATEQVELSIALERLAATQEALTELVRVALGVPVEDLRPDRPERQRDHLHLVPRTPGGRARPGGGR